MLLRFMQVQLTHDRPCEMTGISHERVRYSGHSLPPLLPLKAVPIGAFHPMEAPGLPLVTQAGRTTDPEYPLSSLLVGSMVTGTQTRTGRIEKIGRCIPSLS